MAGQIVAQPARVADQATAAAASFDDGKMRLVESVYRGTAEKFVMTPGAFASASNDDSAAFIDWNLDTISEARFGPAWSSAPGQHERFEHALLRLCASTRGRNRRVA